MEAGQEWVELGHAVKARRMELRLSMVDAALRTREGGRRGFSDQTWQSIEKGERDRRRDTLSDLSWALGWTEDSATRVLAGQPPIVRSDAKPRTPLELALDEDPSYSEVERAAIQAVLDLIAAKHEAEDR